MSYFVDIHTHKKTFENRAIVNLALGEALSDTDLHSIGLHPWDIKKVDFETILDEIERQLASKERIIALGECGIDRLIETDLEIQIRVFKKQIELSEKFKLPLIIHCVKAYSDIQKLIKELKPKQSWVFHGFNSNALIAQQLINSGCYISFGSSILYNSKTQNVLKTIAIESVFFETDDSNERIEDIYKKAAELRHTSIDSLKEQIIVNFKKVF